MASPAFSQELESVKGERTVCTRRALHENTAAGWASIYAGGTHMGRKNRVREIPDIEVHSPKRDEGPRLPVDIEPRVTYIRLDDVRDVLGRNAYSSRLVPIEVR